jgi:hypothetical protein
MLLTAKMLAFSVISPNFMQNVTCCSLNNNNNNISIIIIITLHMRSFGRKGTAGRWRETRSFRAMSAAYHEAMFKKCFEAIFHFETMNRILSVNSAQSLHDSRTVFLQSPVEKAPLHEQCDLWRSQR